MHQFHSTDLESDGAYKATLQGDIFQLKLLMAVALRARKLAHGFVLNTEVKAAEKFDDLVIEYIDTATVLQAKHTSKGAKYNKKDFLKDYKGEASLVKYFDSFIRMRDKKLFHNKPVQYVFLTNRGLEKDDFFDCLVAADEPDKNLSFDKENAACWQFSEDFIKQVEDQKEIYAEFASAIKDNSSVYYQLLSQDLNINMRAHKKVIENDLNELITTIVDALDERYTEGERNKFSIELTGKKSKDARNLLLSILQQVGEHTYTEFTQEFREDNKLTEFQKKIRQLLISKLSKKLKINENIAIQMLGKIVFKYTKEISSCVWQPKDKPNTVKLEVNEEDNALTWLPTKEQSYFLVGMYGQYQFKYIPDADLPLSGLTIYRTLNKAIIAAIKTIDVVNVDEIEEKFSTYLTEFFTAFRIKSGQPSEAELETIIQKELNIDFKFSGIEYYSQFLHKMLNWMKDVKGKIIDKKQLEDFFKQVSLGIERLHLTGYSIHAQRFLDDYREIQLPNDIQVCLKKYVTTITKKPSIMLLYGDDKMGLALSICQVVQELQKQKLLQSDNWGFAGPDCRILDKVPGVLSKNYQLMVIDHAGDLLSKQDILNKIIQAALDSNKKLILLCSLERIADIKKLIRSENIIEQKMPDLSDENVGQTCKVYLDKYVFIAGREHKIGDILAAKVGGIFVAMHTASHLAFMLKNAKTASKVNSDPDKSVYVAQRIKTYTAFYRLKQIISKMPERHLLLIDNEKELVTLQRELSECVVLKPAEIVQYSQDNKKDDDLDCLSIFEKCCEGKYTQKQLENLGKSKVVVIVNLTKIDHDNSITRILSYLRVNHPIIVISDKLNFKIKNIESIRATLKNNKVFLTLSERYFFGQPEYELEDDAVETAYIDLNFIKRSSRNLPSCISANPGTGKSENFRELIKQWSIQNNLQASYHWLILINLIDIDDQFVDRPLAKLLVSYYCKTNYLNLTTLELSLWETVLQYDIQHGYVKLLLDGWDEVKGIRKSLVRKFINNLPTTVHYDIAMRPYVFKSAPSFVYQRVELQPFSHDDLIKYLQKRFIIMCEDEEFPPEKLKIFIDTIMSWLNNADEKMADVVKIPLLAFLLSESLKNEWKDWLKSENEIPDGPWGDIAKLNLITLYEIFIVAKSKIYLQHHIGVVRKEVLGNDNQILQLVTNLLETMEEIAFAELFNNVIPAKKSVTPEIYRALLDFGIIIGKCEEELDNTIEYRYRFLQQTFKELFAALYIVKALMRSHDDPIYKSVFNTITSMRYEVGFKVVWRFVRDLLEYGSILLLSTKTVGDARTVFATPEDHIGVATRNLLSQLGLNDGAIKTHEMSPTAIITSAYVEIAKEDSHDTQSINNLDNILIQLENNLNNKDQAISILRKLPAVIPNAYKDRYNQVLGKALNSWAYRLTGDAAQRMSGIDCEIHVDSLAKLYQIVLDSRCYSSERKDAIRAMLKVNKLAYISTYDYFVKILDDNKVSLEFKVVVLHCLEQFIGVDKKLTARITEKMIKGFDCAQEGSYYSEALLRRLLLIKLHNNDKRSFKGHKPMDLAMAIAKELTFFRLDLLSKLIDHEFITLEDIKLSLLVGLTEYNNRSVAADMLANLLSYLQGKQNLKMSNTKLQFDKKDLQENTQELFFLMAILHKPTTLMRPVLFDSALTLVNRAIFEQAGHENHWRFWRLDAGIPIAKLLLQTPLKVSAFAYLIYQVRNNTGAYDVSNKIGDFLREIDSNDYSSRCMMLYVAFEYLVINQNKFSKGGYFRNVDEWSGMINRLVNLSWRHFVDDKGYPLIGLDVIFAIGVCYGLPLIEDDKGFKLLLVNINQQVISSPELNSHQRKIIKEHMSHLRDLSGKHYSLQQIVKKYDELVKEINTSLKPQDKAKEIEVKINAAIQKITKNRPSIMTPSIALDRNRFDSSKIFTIKKGNSRQQELPTEDSDKERRLSFYL